MITADDDYLAVIARGEIVGTYIESRIVNIKSNTLPQKSGHFTTLATIYEICAAYEETLIQRKPDVSKFPPLADLNLAKRNLKEFWTKFLEIDAYKSSILNPHVEGDARRAEIREQSVICKPIVQRALAEAICHLISTQRADGSRFSVKEVVDRINTIDWSPGEPTWQGILMIGDKVITGNSAMKFAARILAYQLGNHLEAKEKTKLIEQFRDSTDGKVLPDPFFD